MRKNKRPQYKYITPPKKFRKLRANKKWFLALGASVLAVAVTGTSIWHVLKSSVELEARESFSGIAKVVENHDEENPFVILDIVPGVAIYNDGSADGREVSLGTIGYLAGGGSSIEQSLAQAFTNNPGSYDSYTDRVALANSIIPSGMSSEFPWISYQEGYGSITPGLSTANGWTQIRDGYIVGTDGSSGTLDIKHSGMLRYVKVTQNPNPGTDNTPGYDYDLVGGTTFSTPSDAAPVIQGDNVPYRFSFTDQYTAGYFPTSWTPVSNEAVWWKLADYSGDKLLYKLDTQEGFTYFYPVRLDELNIEFVPSTGDGTPSDDTQGNGTVAPSEDDAVDTQESGDSTDVTSLGWMKLVKADDDTPADDIPADDIPADDNSDDDTSDDDNPDDDTLDDDTPDNNTPGDNTPDNNNPGDNTPDNNTPSDNTPDNNNQDNNIPDNNNPSDNNQSGNTDGNPPSSGTGLVPKGDRSSYDDLYIVEFTYDSGFAPQSVYLMDGAPAALALSDDTQPDADLSEMANASQLEFVYVGVGNGEFRLEEVSAGSDGAYTDVTIYNAPVYFRCCRASDWLERYVFHSLEDDDNASESFDIQVKIVTANEVTLEDVADADLIYLESGLNAFLDINNAKPYYINEDNDMSGNILLNIVARAVNDLLPVIVDYDIVIDENNYKDTNYQKLAQIFLKKDLAAFYQDMETVDNMFLNLESSDHPDKTDNNYNYVNRNVYMVHSERPLVNADFPDSFDRDTTSAGFMEVIAAIKAENSTLAGDDRIPEEVSKAKAVQYIINYSVGLISEYRDFTILELQPTSNTRSDLQQNYDADKDSTVLYWKRADSNGSGQQILRSSNLINITVDTKSVAQFSGELSDINNTYQMVFIGLDGQRLNYDEEEKETVYNDGNMNGRVYAGVGDIASENGERYGKIDITPQKRNALLDFMRAGYPIVVEDECFVDKTAKEVGRGAINTQYIDESSQMYDFLSTAVSEYEEYIYTISDVHSSAVFAAQINVRRPKINFADDEGNVLDESIRLPVQTVAADEEGNYQGTINYRVTDDTGDAYGIDVSLRLYLDMNQDGRFAPEEEVDSFSADNGQLIVNFETPEKGIIPWKLELSDAGNSCRRDELTGFFQIVYGNLVPVRILQVVDETGNPDYDLSKAYEEKNRLGHYLSGAEGLTGTQFEIETLTVAELVTALGENERYLNGYDVLVLGFGPAYHLGEAAGAVNQYMAEGRAVLVSQAAASGAVERMGLNTSLMGQQDDRTYVSLGRDKDSVEYYQYADLHGGMFDAQSELPATKINDGVISHYPYEVGREVTITRQLQGADYLLNMALNGAEDNTIADVTAWYVLSNPPEYALENPTAYDVSRMDAANNYYIYSRGNVVYVGQDSYPYAFDNLDEETLYQIEGTAECKLFVNALMAAYNVGVKNPQVMIVAGLAGDSAEIESICIPFDEQIKEDTGENAGLLDEETDLYFKMLEPNMAFEKTVEIAFYYENAGGEAVDIGGKTVQATRFESTIWTVDQNQLVEVETPDLTPGKVYKIKAPVLPLENAGSTNADIYVVVRSVFHKLGQERTAIGCDSVSLNRAQLFLLE